MLMELVLPVTILPVESWPGSSVARWARMHWWMENMYGGGILPFTRWDATMHFSIYDKCTLRQAEHAYEAIRRRGLIRRYDVSKDPRINPTNAS